MTAQYLSPQMEKHDPMQDPKPANAVSQQAKALEMPIQQIHVPVSKPVNSIHPYFNCNIQASNSDKYDDLKHEIRRLKRMMKKKELHASVPDLLADSKAQAHSKAGQRKNDAHTSREKDPHHPGLSALSELRVQHLEHELQQNTKALREMTKVLENSSPNAEVIPDPVESSWY